jgi:Zn-dependent M28 family amino/carboxypeptidase
MAVRNDNNWVTETDMDISGLVAAGKEVRELKNIIAVLPGTGDEIVVIGAHYDHMGVDTTLVGDQCYNGADDNASGVSAVVQIAKAMGLSGCRPRRSVVFAFWDGEEKGLLGSRYFVKKHPFIENIAAYMNFDMIGRGPIENPGHLSYLYTAANPLFGEWLRADAARYEFCFTPLYKASENLLSGSDNAPFARVGIPIVWYHTEGHPDYHRPSDTADKVDYPKLFDITRAAYLCAWRLANEVGY